MKKINDLAAGVITPHLPAKGTDEAVFELGEHSYHLYKYPRPAFAVDCALFGLEDKLMVALIQRKESPHGWALPGGFVHDNESAEKAVVRELGEETGVKIVSTTPFGLYSKPDRDPRCWVVAGAYFSLVRSDDYELEASTDAEKATWFPVEKALRLLAKTPLGHTTMLVDGLKALRQKFLFEAYGFELLPDEFTIPKLHHLYEQVLDRSFDKRNFYTKVKKTGLLKPIDRVQQDVPHRRAQYYRFNKRELTTRRREGTGFQIMENRPRRASST